MVAEVVDEDWILSESSEDEAEVALMAFTEEASTSNSTFADDLKKAEMNSLAGDWNPATMYKVSNFATYSEMEKSNMFAYLLTDMQMSCD